MASPRTLSVGDSLSLRGRDFIPRTRGNVVLRFRGTYATTTGEKMPVILNVAATVHGATRVSWRLWPHVLFDRKGSRLGTFSGTVTAVNMPDAGQELSSAALPLTVVVGPSIIPLQVKASGIACQEAVNLTALEKTPMSLIASVAGLAPGTTAAPLTFTWTLSARQWTLGFAHKGGVLSPDTGAVEIKDRVTTGAFSTLAPAGGGKLDVTLGATEHKGVALGNFKTGLVPARDTVMKADVAVEVANTKGKKLRLAFTLDVRRMYDVVYEGKTRLRERYAPQRVCGCIPGGDKGRDVQYTEGVSETRSRYMTFNYNASIATTCGSSIPSNPFMLGIDFSRRFGVDINGVVSSAKSPDLLITGQIKPNHYGVFYRQTSKVEHVAYILITNACGRGCSPGKAMVTDWRFTPDLATDPSCPPPTKLPRAELFY